MISEVAGRFNSFVGHQFEFLRKVYKLVDVFIDDFKLGNLELLLETRDDLSEVGFFLESLFSEVLDHLLLLQEMVLKALSLLAIVFLLLAEQVEEELDAFLRVLLFQGGLDKVFVCFEVFKKSHFHIVSVKGAAAILGLEVVFAGGLL